MCLPKLRSAPLDRYDAEIMESSRATETIAPTSPRRHALLFAAALLAGLLLRLWFIARFSQIAGDTLLYGDIARNWLQHGVYGFTRTLNGLPAPPRPTLIRLPGYPLFLAACFRLFGLNRYVPHPAPAGRARSR